jgi:hypothetical protein
MSKYPRAGDVYTSRLYPGQHCRVLNVHHAQVTFQWLGQHVHVEQQVVAVNRFVQDFEHELEGGSVLKSARPAPINR